MPLHLPEMLPRPAGARTDKPSESTRRRWARMAAQVEKDRGIATEEGYRRGWRYGLLCGAIAAAVVTSLAWAAWLTAVAPDAAAPLARPTVRKVT